MENAEKALKTLEETLVKYKKNKTMVPEEDLKGKYKVPFEKLKCKLKNELEKFLKEYILSGLIVKSDTDKVINKIDEVITNECVGKRIRKAAFQHYDLEEVKQIAEECRKKVLVVWQQYFNEHVCLYIYGQCFHDTKPDNPLIYNDLVDKFYCEDTGSWIDREKPPGDAFLLYISGKEKTDAGSI